MPTKKTVPHPPHFHIPADPLRIKSGEIQARHASRQQKGFKASEVTHEMLYEVLSDVLDKQLVLEQRLQQLLQGKSRL